MKNTVNFDTSTKPFSEIIGYGKHYSVPQYQRDYSWREEQWDELWQDILAIHNQNPEEREEHYMGYLVLQKKGINDFMIIDGQQRITTISLLISASLQILSESSNDEDKQRVELKKNSYISTKSPSSLVENYKLELNRNNDEYYRKDLANLLKYPRKRYIKKSEHQMRKAKEYYQKEINKLELNSSEISQYPVLLSAFCSYSENYFAKICKWMHSFCIRYHVICSLPAYDAEMFYNDTAINIHKKIPIDKIKTQLLKMLPEDGTFREHFATKTLAMTQSSKKAYYLLASIENHLLEESVW